MSGDADSSLDPPDPAAGDGDRPACARADCGRPASFWQFDREPGEWRAICGRHARTLHPSLEVGAWLESGYLKPVELGRPEGRPPVPDEPRARALRSAVDAAMGWD